MNTTSNNIMQLSDRIREAISKALHRLTEECNSSNENFITGTTNENTFDGNLSPDNTERLI